LIFLELERYDEALSFIEKGLAAKSDDEILPSLRPIAWAGQGRFADAAVALEQLVAAEVEHHRTYLFAGRAYFVLKKYDKAEECYRRVLNMGKAEVSSHLGVGLACLEQGNFTEAKSHLEKALELNPHLRKARNALASMRSNYTK
jgi:tetratricopeptide (TPR) repeat protein